MPGSSVKHRMPTRMCAERAAALRVVQRLRRLLRRPPLLFYFFWLVRSLPNCQLRPTDGPFQHKVEACHQGRRVCSRRLFLYSLQFDLLVGAPEFLGYWLGSGISGVTGTILVGSRDFIGWEPGWTRYWLQPCIFSFIGFSPGIYWFGAASALVAPCLSRQPVKFFQNLTVCPGPVKVFASAGMKVSKNDTHP